MAGKLKMKGDEPKKKKRSSASKELARGEGSSSKKAEQLEEDLEDAEEPPAPSSGVQRTEAERRFEEVRRQRLAKKAAKEAGKSHKDRVNEFNSYLDKLSEHYDLPKARFVRSARTLLTTRRSDPAEQRCTPLLVYVLYQDAMSRITTRRKTTLSPSSETLTAPANRHARREGLY